MLWQLYNNISPSASMKICGFLLSENFKRDKIRLLMKDSERKAPKQA